MSALVCPTRAIAGKVRLGDLSRGQAPAEELALQIILKHLLVLSKWGQPYPLEVLDVESLECEVCAQSDEQKLNGIFRQLLTAK